MVQNLNILHPTPNYVVILLQTKMIYKKQASIILYNIDVDLLEVFGTVPSKYYWFKIGSEVDDDLFYHYLYSSVCWIKFMPNVESCHKVGSLTKNDSIFSKLQDLHRTFRYAWNNDEPKNTFGNKSR